MTDCIDRDEHCYNLLIEKNIRQRQTEQYGGVCVLVFGGMQCTPLISVAACRPRREKAIHKNCCIQYQTLVFTSPIYP